MHRSITGLIAVFVCAGVSLGLTTRHIGPGRTSPDFTSVEAAVAWLNSNTVTDDYEFRIDAGTYASSATIAMTLAQGSYKIYFRPDVSGSTVTVSYAGGIVWSISGPSNVKVCSLTVTGTGAASAVTIATPGCKFVGCTISGAPPSAGSVVSLASSDDSLVDCQVTHTGNTGAYGVLATAASGAIIKGCSILDAGGTAGTAAAYLAGACPNAVVAGCNIGDGATSGKWTTGIYIAGTGPVNVIGNKVLNDASSSMGIRLTAGTGHLVANNFVKGWTATGSPANSGGLHINGANSSFFYYNTVVSTVANQTSVVLAGAQTVTYDNTFKDNIFYHPTVGTNSRCYYVTTTANLGNVYASNNVLLGDGTSDPVVAQQGSGTSQVWSVWKTRNGLPDATGSMTSDPLLSDYKLTSSSPCRGAGTYLSTVLVDIDGETRKTGVPPNGPDIGCDEYSFAPPNPVISGITRDIQFPFSWEAVVVSATITPPPSKEDIDAAQIKYSTDGGSNWTTDDFTSQNGDVYYFDIPAQAGGITVDYKIYAHSSGGGWTTSPTSSYEVPLDLSIYDVQYTTDPNGVSPYATQRVHVSGVITGRVTSKLFYMKDGDGGAWHGLHLYWGSSSSPQDFVPGDTVDVNGVVQEFSGLTEISYPDRVEKRGSGHSFDTLELTVPEARLEAYEGCLAIVRSIRDITSPPDLYFAAGKAYDVEDEGAEAMKLYSTTYSNFVGAPVPTGYFDLVSNLGEYTSFDARVAQFIPREKEDIVTIADVQAKEILAPTGGMLVGTHVVPVVKVKNLNMTDGVSGVTVRFKIGAVYDKQQAVSLLANEEKNVAFEQWTAVLGTYAVEASVGYAGDPNPLNDVATGQVKVLTSLAGAWSEVKSMPKTPTEAKAPKDGAWMAKHDGTDANPVIYAAKGNKATDFYMYAPTEGDSGTWYEKAAIPANEGTRTKPPSKGCVGVSDGLQYVYMTKGNNTLGFWRYNTVTNQWDSMAGVPLGDSRKKVKGGTDMVYATYKDTGCVYLLKGYKTEFFRYNPLAARWDTLPEVPYGLNKQKYDKGSFLGYDETNRLIYAHQAKYYDKALEDPSHYMFKYDVPGDSWFKAGLTGMPIYMLENGREGKRKKSADGAAGVWYNDHMYALKGGNTQGFFKYFPTGDSWAQLETVPGNGSFGKKKRVKAGGDLVSFGGGVFYASKGNKAYELWQYFTPAAACGTPLAVNRSGVQAGPSVHRSSFIVSPNPLVSGWATLRYSLPKAGPVSLTVFDVAGRSVLRQAYSVGRSASSVMLDLRKLSAGVYLVRLDAEGATQTQKLVVQR